MDRIEIQLYLMSMEYLLVSPESLKRAAEVLRSGGLVAFPTETVYGLGADAYNSEALAKVFEVKGRPRFDPLIIHIASIKALGDAADLSLLNEETRQKLFLLAEKLWPGPLSLVLPKNERIPNLATAGLSTAAFRLPANELARELISLSNGAVAAPSANPFGALSPTRAEHVRDKLGEKIDIILDGGPAHIGVESTVLDITSKNIRILRPGGTPKETIEKLIGAVGDNDFQAGEMAFGLASPGMLKSHYAPQTPLSAFSKKEIIRLPCEKNCTYLFFDGLSRDKWLEMSPNASSFSVLSETGSLIEAAARLFDVLHELEKGGFSRIYAQFAPQEGLGAAINDRLRRASSE